ncbi:MAG: chemotaxis protein CheW [Rhodospirillaceae bacterium]
MNAIAPLRTERNNATEGRVDYLTFHVAGAVFAVRAVLVRDVLRLASLTAVPLAQREVAGLINLRGHVVTAIDLASRLDLPSTAGAGQRMSIVIERGNEAYCFIVNGVGDVIGIESSEIETNPASMDQRWAGLSRGVFKKEKDLVVLLDIDAVLDIRRAKV